MQPTGNAPGGHPGAFLCVWPEPVEIAGSATDLPSIMSSLASPRSVLLGVPLASSVNAAFAIAIALRQTIRVACLASSCAA